MSFPLENLEKFLNATNKTVDFKKEMEGIEVVCEIEFQGSKSLKDLHILVILNGIEHTNLNPI